MFSFIKELGKIDVEYKYDDSDDNNNVFKSYIKSVETEYILIDFLFYKGAEYNIPNEKQITVKFKEKMGIIRGFPVLKFRILMLLNLFSAENT